MGMNSQYFIKGIPYRSADVQKLFKNKSYGTTLLVKRESDNPHDPNAMAVYAALTLPGENNWQWHKVGYMSASDAKREFSDLDKDIVFEARNTGHGSFALTGRTRKVFK